MFKKLLTFLCTALFAVSINAETWEAGAEIAAANLQAGDIILLKNANTANADALWFGGYHIVKTRTYPSGCANFSLGMFPAIKDRSAFELVPGPTMEGKASFYFKEVTTGQYISAELAEEGYVDLKANINDATSFVPTAQSNGAYLISYKEGTGWRFMPFHSYGEMYIGTGGGDMAGFKFYKAIPKKTSFAKSDQVDCTELADGMEILMCVPYGYYENRSATLGDMYLENKQISSAAHVYIGSPFSNVAALATSVGYNEDNVWVLEYASPASTTGYSDIYYLKSKSTGDYIFRDTDQNAQSSAMTSDRTKAATFTFGPKSAAEYSYADHGNVMNDKTVSMFYNDPSYNTFGSAHGYGFAIYNSEKFANWNIYQVESKKVQIGSIYYILYGDKAEVTYPDDAEPTETVPSAYTGDIEIPATVTYGGKTYNVTSVADKAFRYSTITSVTFNEGLQTIGDYAFQCCLNLTSVELPNSVTTLGAQAFAGGGYSSRMNITSFRFGSGVKTAVQVLYFNQTGSTDVYVPTTAVPYVGSSGHYSFDGTANLVKVHVYPRMVADFQANDGWQRYTIVGDFPGTKVQVGDLYYETYPTGDAIVTYPNSSEPTDTDPSTYTGSITIPASITAGGQNYNVVGVKSKAFYYSSITDVTIPSSVESIGDNAFAQSTAMTSVTFSEGLKTMGDYAFHACFGLTTVELPNSLITMGKQTFAGIINGTRMNITSFRFGTGITTCDKFLYFNKTSIITDVYVPTYIVPYTGQYPVEGGKNNRIHVYPSMVADFEAHTYWSRYNIIGDLPEVYVNGICYDLDDVNHTATVINRGKLVPTSSVPSFYTGDITIPATIEYGGVTYNVTAVGQDAFRYSTITSVTFSEGMQTIGTRAFGNCASLTTVELPNSVTETGFDAFAHSGVTTITFGSGISKVNQGCCYGCSVANVYMKATSVPSGASYMFQSATTIHVYPDMLSSFTSASYWSAYNYADDLVRDYTYAELQAKADALAALPHGTDPNSCTADSYAAVTSALATFATLSASSPASAINSCMNEFVTAEANLVGIPVTEGYYFIASAGNGPGYSGGPYEYEDDDAMYNAEGIVKWKAYDNTDASQLYYLTQKEGNSWYVYNVMDASYIDNGGTGNSGTVYTSANKVNGQEFHPMVTGSGKFAIKSPSYCYGLAQNHNGSPNAEGNLCIWGTVNDSRAFGVNVWYLHKISNADAEQLIANAVANTNAVVVMPTNETGGHTNVISNGVCSNLVLTDGQPFSAPSDFTATTASYTRTMTNEWGTICLPYDVSSDATTKYYTISSIENNALVVSEVTTLTAGTPALVQKVSGDAITVTATNAPVSATINNTTGSVNMYGVFERTKVEDANAYYIKDNKFWQCNNYFYCGAFRAYFTVSGAGSNSFSIIADNDTPTAIASAEADSDAAVAIYGTDGTRLGTLRSGINIVKQANGKTRKVFVK